METGPRPRAVKVGSGARLRLRAGLQAGALCGGWEDTLAVHSAGGSGRLLRWAAERTLDTRSCWRSWKEKASSTRPRGWREAASQGERRLWPFSSRGPRLSEDSRDRDEEAEAGLWHLEASLDGGEWE